MAALDWDHHQFNVISAYLLCDPKGTSFARFPSAFREYLVAISNKAEVPTGGSMRSHEINDVPSAICKIGYLKTRTRPDASLAYGIMSQITYPSMAMPDASNTTHASTLVKTLWWISTTCNDDLTFRRAVGLSLRAGADSTIGCEPAMGSHGTCLPRSTGFITLCGACIWS
jgi:hypothetical protein